MNDEKGTTLIEIILVLVLILIMSSLVIPIFTSTITRMEAEALKDQIQRDLNWAMQRADVKQKTIYMVFAPTAARYALQEEGKTLILREYNPKYLVTNNFYNQLIINTQGNVNRSGTIEIKTAKKTLYRLTIQISTGSVREEKL